MKKIINIILKVVLVVMLLMPILGTFGIFPAPTREMYNTDIAFEFITMLMNVGYINWMMAVVFALCVALIFKKKMALVALLLLPITLNIVAFHTVLDGGLFKAGAIMGNVFFLINLYFLWQSKDRYKALL